jgi:hypothetical protein
VGEKRKIGGDGFAVCSMMDLGEMIHLEPKALLNQDNDNNDNDRK